MPQERRPHRWTEQAIVVTALFFAALAVIVVGGRPDALAALLLIPAWCWSIGGLVHSGLLWRAGRRCLAGTGLLFWLAFTSRFVEEVVALSRAVVVARYDFPAPPMPALRVVTLNAANSELCVEDLQNAAADVVFLQESPGGERLATLTQELFGDEGSFLDGGDTAILARGTLRPIFVERGAHYAAAVVKPPSANSLCCVSLRLVPPASRLDIASGGFWQEHRRLRDQRRAQLQAVAEVCQKHADLPFIVAGDFNTVPLDPSLDRLRPRLTDSFSQQGAGWGATGVNEWPLFRVDQIWTSDDVVPHLVTAHRTLHSDHRLVLGVYSVRLPPAPAR